MDPDPPSSTPRKLKFAPKAPPPRRTPKSTSTKIEPAAQDDGDDGEAHETLDRKVQEHLTKRGSKQEKKSSVQVTFSHGVGGSSTLRTFGRQKEKSDDGHNAADDYMQDIVTSMSTDGTGVDDDLAGLTDAVTVKKKKEYREPWDYDSYYPTILPLRKPNSGDPELLDEAEFDEALEYDENSLSSASDLGLLDVDDTPRMLLFKFPSSLPIGRRPTSASRRGTVDTNSIPSGVVSATSKGKEIAGSSSRISGTNTGIKGKETAGSSINPVSGYSSKEGCSLEELPDGYMGKMLVYKSGAVKLKLGDILYDVSPGSDCTLSQFAMAINTTDRNCCVVGEPNKWAIVTPDIDSLLDNINDLG